MKISMWENLELQKLLVYQVKQLITSNHTPFDNVFEISMVIVKYMFEDGRKNPEENFFPFLTTCGIFMTLKHA